MCGLRNGGWKLSTSAGVYDDAEESLLAAQIRAALQINCEFISLQAIRKLTVNHMLWLLSNVRPTSENFPTSGCTDFKGQYPDLHLRRFYCGKLGAEWDLQMWIDQHLIGNNGGSFFTVPRRGWKIELT